MKASKRHKGRIELYFNSSTSPMGYAFTTLENHLKLKQPYRVYKSKMELLKRGAEVSRDNNIKGWCFIKTLYLTQPMKQLLVTYKLLNNE